MACFFLVETFVHRDDFSAQALLCILRLQVPNNKKYTHTLKNIHTHMRKTNLCPNIQIPLSDRCL